MWLFLHVNHNGITWEIVPFQDLSFVPLSSCVPWLLQCALMLPLPQLLTKTFTGQLDMVEGTCKKSS